MAEKIASVSGGGGFHQMEFGPNNKETRLPEYSCLRSHVLIPS